MPEELSKNYPGVCGPRDGFISYRIVVAVAGFADDDITITVQDSSLIITGKAKQDKDKVEYLYRGIAGRAFEKHFQLADFIKVGEAHMENGLLKIALLREIPEAMKPRVIHIKNNDKNTKLIEQK